MSTVERVAAALVASYGHYDDEDLPQQARIRAEDVMKSLRSEGIYLVSRDELAEAICDSGADGNPKLGGVPWRFRNADERAIRAADAAAILEALDQPR